LRAHDCAPKTLTGIAPAAVLHPVEKHHATTHKHGIDDRWAGLHLLTLSRLGGRLAVSIENLKRVVPNVEWVSLVYAWFGTSVDDTDFVESGMDAKSRSSEASMRNKSTVAGKVARSAARRHLAACSRKYSLISKPILFSIPPRLEVPISFWQKTFMVERIVVSDLSSCRPLSEANSILRREPTRINCRAINVSLRAM
jgi:hypothetical protein